MVVSGSERLAKLLQETALVEAGVSPHVIKRAAKSATPARQ
jgi:chaperonin GroEL (HSP60 family)